MKKKLLHLYAQEWNWFRTRVLKLFLVTLLVFLAASVAYYFYYVNQPEKTQSKFLEIQKKYPSLFEQLPARWKLAFSIFAKNVIVTFFNILWGLVPLLFIPLIRLIKMCSFLGVTSSYIHMKRYNILILATLSIAPHGIIEIPAVSYSYCLGIMISFKMSKKLLDTVSPFRWKPKEKPLFSQNHEERETLSSFISHCFKSWLLVIVPLLLIAALIEAFITPLLLK